MIDIDINWHNSFMDSVLKKYELMSNGSRLEVYLKYDEYDHFNSLAVSLYFEPVIMNVPIYDMTDSLDLFSGLELFAVITINLPDQTSISFLGNKSDLLYLPKEKNNE